MIKRLFIAITLFFSIFLLGNAPQGVHQVNSFESLPLTSGQFDTRLKLGTGEIGEAKLTRSSLDKWDVQVSYLGDTFLIKDVNIPYKDIRKNVTNGFYWTKETNGIVNRYLIYSSDGSMSSLQAVEAALEAADYRPFQIWTVWNITTGEHETQEKLKVFGVIRKDGNLYSLDVAMNVPTDELASITIDYTYSEKIIWLFQGKSERIRYTAIADNYVQFVKGGNIVSFSTEEIMTALEANSVEELPVELFQRSAIVQRTVNLTEKEEFMNKYNNYVFEENRYRAENDLPANDWKIVASVDDIFADDHIYNIPLRKHSSFFTTNMDITDIAIIDLVYRYQGVTYHVAYDDIDTFVPDYREPVVTNQIQDWLEDFWGKNKWYIIGIGSLVLIGVIGYFAAPLIMQAGAFSSSRNRSSVRSKPRKKRSKRK